MTQLIVLTKSKSNDKINCAYKVKVKMKQVFLKPAPFYRQVAGNIYRT